VSFFWRALECELCGMAYPTTVSFADPSTDVKTVELFEIPRPLRPYIILEPKVQNGKGLHIVSLASAKSARLGRGHDSDIRISDISVSRHHAWLKFSPSKHGPNAISHTTDSTEPNHEHAEGFYIEDPQSKFGTLMELRQPHRMEHGTSFSLQAGRTVMIFSVKRQWGLIPGGCFKSRRNRQDIVCQVVTNPLSSSSPGFSVPGLVENAQDHVGEISRHVRIPSGSAAAVVASETERRSFL